MVYLNHQALILRFDEYSHKFKIKEKSISYFTSMKTKVWLLIALVKDPTNVSKATQWFFSGYLPTSPWFQPWVSRGKRSRNKKLGWQGRRLKACPVAWGITWVNNQRTTPWELCFQSWEAFWSSLVGLNSPNILHPIPLPSACVLSCSVESNSLWPHGL